MNAIVPVQAYQVSDMERMARALAGSKLFGIQNPEQALALCLVAQAEGRHPATAAQDYNIIQGRPAKKADAMLRDFIAGGGKVEWHTLNNEKADATFSHPAGGSARIDWDMARAKDAGLGGKDMWKKFPRQMLRARVVSEGVRTVYPMATSGMYVPEEVQDFDREPLNVTPALEAPEKPTETDGRPPARYGPNGRMIAASAKERGEHDIIQQQINECDLSGLVEWETNFDEWTAHLPASWLDRVHDIIELRREELLRPAEADDMDEAYRQTVGPAEKFVAEVQETFPGTEVVNGKDADRPNKPAAVA